MRFVFGLILGALLTLLLASLLEAPLATTTAAVVTVAEAADPPADPGAGLLVEQLAEPLPERPKDPQPEAAPQSASKPQPAPVALRPNLPSGIPTGSSAQKALATPPDAALQPGTVSVWQPFHSEASAQGFARRLSTQLGYPFSVSRVAAAEYHVVFAYANEAERGLLESQLSALTGRTYR